MEKLLTVSIAAYNVSQYLSRALDSFLIPEVMDEIEVLIENDGSTDSTPEIAQKYVDQYPGTFRLVNKKNGGYGTTVNESMALATGKYFRLLDGDDWYDQDGLRRLIGVLRDCESDYVITRYQEMHEQGDGTFKEKYFPTSWEKFEGQTLQMKDIDFDFNCTMWGTTIRTALIKEHPFTLPGRILYTDALFVYSTMPYVHTITFLPDVVYLYRIGRDGQSVSVEQIASHYMDQVGVQYRNLRIYHDGATDENRHAMLTRMALYYYGAVRMLLKLPPSDRIFRTLTTMRRIFKETAPEVYKDAVRRSSRLRLLEATGYLAYWAIAGK